MFKLNQWFTFKYNNNNLTDFVYSCSNNHYIDEWMAKHGYVEFTNPLTLLDLDLLIHDLNQNL